MALFISWLERRRLFDIVKNMPAKNSIKEYRADSYYHIYNRGVEKRDIFMDNQDYAVFTSYIKNYLLPKDVDFLQETLTNPQSTPKQKSESLKLLRMNNFHGNITLVAYCLMSNHFHLLLKQTDSNGIDKFMNSLMTRYTMYFNHRYKRVGPLSQGNYKAVLVQTEEQLLHLSRYIHTNPTSKGVAFQSYPHSSYMHYLSYTHDVWINPKEVLDYFSKQGFNSYPNFVNDNNVYESVKMIAHLVLSEPD